MSAGLLGLYWPDEDGSYAGELPGYGLDGTMISPFSSVCTIDGSVSPGPRRIPPLSVVSPVDSPEEDSPSELCSSSVSDSVSAAVVAGAAAVVLFGM